MENEKTVELEHIAKAYLEDINFSAVYSHVVSLVEDEPKIVFTPEVDAKLKGIEVDFSEYQGASLKDFFKKTSHDGILTMEGEFKVSNNFFKLVNIACYEHILLISRDYEEEIMQTMKAQNYTDDEIREVIYMFRKQFFEGVFAKRNKHFEKEIRRGRACYQNLDKYIECCVSGAILNIHLLSCRDKNVYSDYLQNKLSIKTN